MIRVTLTTIVILSALTSCGPTPTPSETTSPDVLPVADKFPAITEEQIARDLIGKGVQVSDAAGEGPSDIWTFEADEFRLVKILERQRSDNGLTVIISMTTRNNPTPNEESIQASGKLRLLYEQHGTKWVLSRIEDLTFNYSIGVGI